MQRFRIPQTNGSYEFEVGNFADAERPYHQIMIEPTSTPAAGFLKIEARASEDSDWVVVQESKKIPIADPSMVQFSIVAKYYRFTVFDMVGGANQFIVLRVFDSMYWMGAQAPVGLYDGSRAMTIQGYTEANVKNGLQFETSYSNLSLAPGASLDLVFKTTTKPVLVKNRQIAFTGAGVTATVYKDTQYTGGTLNPTFNLSDVSPQASTVEAYVGATIIDPGTQSAAQTIALGTATGAGNAIGTYQVTGLERALNLGKTYMLRITNNDSQACKVAAYITWYEGIPDLPR